MGSADWTLLNDGLDIAALDRGVTTGVARPPGGGNFVYAYNSLVATAGAAGLFVALPDFAPLAKGGSIRGCIQRGPGGGATGFAPFFFLSGQGPSVRDRAYLLGLSDEDPHRLVLRKGVIANGLADADAPNVLLKSAGTFSQGTWLHVRLDQISNENGDVVLQVFQNDLTAHPLGSPPDWQPVSGMSAYLDDALSINSGSPPLTSGRAGFALSVRDVTRRAYFDQIELYRQV